MTIVKNVIWCADYPFSALSPEAHHELTAVGATLSCKTNRYGVVPVLRLLECYLQLTRQTVSFDDLRSEIFVDIAFGFLGALHSQRLADVGVVACYGRSRYFLDLLRGLNSIHLEKVTSLSLGSSGRPCEELLPWVEKFKHAELDADAEWLWNGWIVTSKLGTRAYLPLYDVWLATNRSFTDKFHAACSEYYSARAGTQFPLLSRFTKFFRRYVGKELVASLEDPDFVSDFYFSFFEEYFRAGYAEGNQVEVMTESWSRFVHFSENYLLGKVIARPYCALPRPPKQLGSKMRNLRTQREGSPQFLSLLTPIPLEVSDDQALRLLFCEIEKDLETIKRWARLEIASHWARHEDRIKNSAFGVAYEYGDKCTNTGTYWLVDPANPQRFVNASATFEKYGMRPDFPRRSLYPRPIDEVTKRLGVPYRTSLLAHAALLVAEHPAITTTYLEKLQLYDKDGVQVGFVQTDAGWYLIGEKPRRGAEEAEQKILLNSETVEVVRQAISLTSPLRAYLREKGDENWRLLFLETASLVTTPRPAQFMKAASAPDDRLRLQERIQSTLGVGAQEASDCAGALTLKRIRASAGVVVYLKTGSEEAMARALGHKRYQPDLLSRYLPRVLQEFFQERWVRIFQTGIILEAMKDSPLLLEASGFASMDEVDQFLSNHCLRHIPACLDGRKDESPKDHELSVRFGLDFGVLTMLVSIVAAVESSSEFVGETAKKWAVIGRRLINYIQSNSDRPDIQMMLKKAEVDANPAQVMEMIHAQS